MCTDIFNISERRLNGLECANQLLFSYWCSRQIHTLCEEKAQLVVAYETIKSLPPTHSPPSPLSTSVSSSAVIPLLSPYSVSNVPSPTLSESNTPTLSVTRTPNICVEDGRIEFIKDEVDGVVRVDTLCINNNNNNNHHLRESMRHSKEEKIDNAKVRFFTLDLIVDINEKREEVIFWARARCKR